MPKGMTRIGMLQARHPRQGISLQCESFWSFTQEGFLSGQARDAQGHDAGRA